MKLMFTCEEISGVLSDIVDGKASRWSRMLFYMHIAMCKHCRSYYRQFRELKEVSGTMIPLEDLPDDFARVMERSLQFSRVKRVSIQTTESLESDARSR